MTLFSMINRKNRGGYHPHYQRHHLIPLQVASISTIREPLDKIGSAGFDFDDFEKNGVLLPSDEKIAFETGRSLHRGPHPRYNMLVIERLSLIIQLSNQIENDVQRKVFFRLRIALLQSVLRRALVGSALPVFRLNKKDPSLPSSAFAELDSSVDALYVATQWSPVRRDFNR